MVPAPTIAIFLKSCHFFMAFSPKQLREDYGIRVRNRQ